MPKSQAGDIRCPECGTVCPVEVKEEALVRLSNQEILAGTREFYPTCPTHGPFGPIRLPVMHHSTHLVKRLSMLFPREDRERLRAILTGEDREHFEKALEGRANAREGDVARWLERLATP
jgi:hypothetical protein